MNTRQRSALGLLQFSVVFGIRYLSLGLVGLLEMSYSYSMADSQRAIDGEHIRGLFCTLLVDGCEMQESKTSGS